MNQKLVFKYRPESLTELEAINHFLTRKISLSHMDLPNCPTVLQYLHPYEKETSLKAIREGKTNLKESDVEYHINSLGYRGERTVEEMYNSTGVWGCSYTFGVGMPAKDTYANILADKIETPIHNFGIPGAGIQKITKSFIVNNNFFKFKTAFFVLPSMYRFEYLSLNSYDTPEEIPSDNISTFDLIPNWLPSHNKELARKAESFYELFDDAFFLAELIKNLELIKQNAEINGTKVYFATWCNTTYKLFVKYDIPEFKIVQFVENNQNLMGKPTNDFARDGFHPGLRSHIATAETLYDLYNPPSNTDSSLKPNPSTSLKLI